MDQIKITKIEQNPKIRKILQFTDIHFGKKNNSILHNQDCLNFIDFVCDSVKKDKEIDAIAFLGDWFENRNAINVETLNLASEGADKLNALGIPIYFVVGNHDLYQRFNRRVFATRVFKDKKNFVIIDHFVILNDEILFSPFLFHQEYPQLAQFANKVKYAMGHFEFKNFVLTGTSNIMEKGPDHTAFDFFTFIFSGHYHKRQIKDNTIYIGSTFPMDYGDTGDRARGFCVLDTRNDDVNFFDWEGCPLYQRVLLSQIIDGAWEPAIGARVTCFKDIDISYTNAQDLRDAFIKTFDLREFRIDEKSQEKKDSLTESTEELDLDILTSSSLDDAIRQMIISGVQKTTTIDPERLSQEYAEL
jgi:DNA repair exonuclease SbcCD nuclease subunit